jgi:hypothetical protein
MVQGDWTYSSNCSTIAYSLRNGDIDLLPRHCIRKGTIGSRNEAANSSAGQVSSCMIHSHVTRDRVIIVLHVSLDYRLALETPIVATIRDGTPVPIPTPRAILLLVFCDASELLESSLDLVLETDVESPSTDLTAARSRNIV